MNNDVWWIEIVHPFINHNAPQVLLLQIDYVFQINELFATDENVGVLCFPILLFNSDGETNSSNSNANKHELKFMNLLERYFLQRFYGNHSSAAKELGLVNEILFYIRKL